MRHLSVGLFILGASCATTPAVVAPAAPRLSPVAAAKDAQAAVVAVDLVEWHFTVEADGTSTLRDRQVYRLLSADPGSRWTSAFCFWRPWLDDAPTLDATIVAADGRTVRLDPRTVSDQADESEDGVITDLKLRLAPLPNLGIGAVVERSFVRKRRPLFVEGTMLTIPFEPEAAEKRRVAIIDVPANVPLHVEVLGVEVTQSREEKNGRVVLRFERGAAAPAERAAPGSPASRGQEALVRVSTVADWRAAARAYAQTLDGLLEPGPAVKALSGTLVPRSATREEKVRALTTWLWTTVRYTGLELDEAAFVPRKPEEVLERKYGDCKDLAVLLVALLRASGVDADVALLSSGFHRDTSPGTPGLNNFDHAIVRVGGGAPLWVDATVPFANVGELPASVQGRMALVARADTSELVRVQSTARSRLDTTIEWRLPPEGPAGYVRTRQASGLFFSDGRITAARSLPEYRQGLEAFARKELGAKGKVHVEGSAPEVPGPYREVLKLEDTSYGSTAADVASGLVSVDQAFAPVSFLFDLEEVLDERTEPVLLSLGASARVVNVFKPPEGYRMAELPETVSEKTGPLSVNLVWERGAGEEVRSTLTVDHAGGTFSVEEVRRFVSDVFPRVDLRANFQNVVLTALDKGKLQDAVKAAEQLWKTTANPAWRGSFAYALASVGLQSEAEREAKAALSAAPASKQVRNRLAFVLLHNDFGVEFGKGYKRDEAIRVLEETVASFPDDEWAARLLALVLVNDADGDFVHTPSDLKKAEEALGRYVKTWDAASVVEPYLDVLMRLKRWERLASDAPKFAQTPQRDGAWLAADAMLNGGEAALRRAQKENRMGDEALTRSIATLITSREYDQGETLARANLKRLGEDPETNRSAQIIRKLKTAAMPPTSSPLYPFIRLMALAYGAPETPDSSEFAVDELTPGFLKSLRDGTRAGTSALPRGGADLPGYLKDILLTNTEVSLTPLAGFGEVAEFRMGDEAPRAMLLKKTGGQYRLYLAPEPPLAARLLELVSAGKDEEAVPIARAVVALAGSGAPRSLKDETGPFVQNAALWTINLAARDPAHRPLALKWLEAQLGRTDLPASHRLAAAMQLRSALSDEPARLLSLAKRMLASKEPEEHRLGQMVEVSALRKLGRHQEVVEVTKRGLEANPRDQFFRAAYSDALAPLGDFKAARAENRKLAQDLPPAEGVVFWNQAAWWSLYLEPDAEALREAERAIARNPSGGRLHTAACVEAAAGRMDNAAVLMGRWLADLDPRQPEHLSDSYWLARGMLAEGFGQTASARSAYARVKKGTPPSAADLWSLSQRRLKTLGTR